MNTKQTTGNCLVTALLASCLASSIQAADSNATASNAGPSLKDRILTAEKAVSTNDFASRYVAYYLEMRPAAEVKKMKKDDQSSSEELVKLAPSNAAYRIALGNLYVENGKADKAAAEFNKALVLPGLTAMQQGDILTGLASAALLNHDRAAAIRFCEELVARNIKTAGRGSPDPVGLANQALRFMKGPELDSLKLPFYTGAKAFPTPQQAKYSEDFVALTSVKLVLGKGIKKDDISLTLLKTKFTRFGIQFADNAPFTIKINAEAEPKAPTQPEGYALTVTRNGAIINAHDTQGIVWGIVSLIQLVDQDKAPKIRMAEILDFPNTACRGFLGAWGSASEFMLFCKLNTTVMGSPQISYRDPTKPWTPLQKEICKAISQQYTSLGMRLYYGINTWTMWCMMPLSSERTFELHKEICSEIAKNGGHIYFPYDDGRFPLPKVDLDKFGSAANMDAKYITRLYKAVKEKNPGFHLVFCPPFYWGPDSAAAYPEPREPYLKSLGDYLDPDIELFWTGPRVKGYQKSKAQVEWFTNLTKHKPMIFQNGTCPHNLLSYITDETPGWKTWHYEGFFENDIAGYLKNGGEAAQVTTLADCLWNIKAYDAAASIRRGVAMLYGKDMFDIIDPANKALAYLDKYPYGEITPEAVTEIPEIERRAKIANEAYQKGLAYNAFSLGNFPGALGGGVRYAFNALESAKKAPDFYKVHAKNIDATRALAETEVGIDTNKGDIFKSPVDMNGGSILVYNTKCPSRFATMLRGQKTTIPRARINFECDPFPPSGDYILNLSAQDDDAEAPCKIRISCNGTTIFEGPSKFARFGWSVEKFTLPFACLKRGNTLTIENGEDSENKNGPPWFMINYAVIKKAVQ